MEDFDQLGKNKAIQNPIIRRRTQAQKFRLTTQKTDFPTEIPKLSKTIKNREITHQIKTLKKMVNWVNTEGVIKEE